MRSKRQHPFHSTQALTHRSWGNLRPRANFRNGREAFNLIVRVKRLQQHCSICRPGDDEEEEEEKEEERHSREGTKKFLKVARLDNENGLGEEKAAREKQHKRLFGTNKVCDVYKGQEASFLVELP